MDSQEKPAGIEAFAQVRRAIVIAAHADDMETMMGGTLLLLRQQGVVFSELIATAGDLGSNDPQWTSESLTAARVEEAHNVAQMMGVESVELLGYHDGELEPTLELRRQIALAYRRFLPDTLFTFDPNGFLLNHPDHRVVSRAALDALIPSSMRLYHPEDLAAGAERPAIKNVFLWAPNQPNVIVDVSSVYDQKVQCSFGHQSQFPNPDSLDWMKRMNKAAGEKIGADYAESFGHLSV